MKESILFSSVVLVMGVFIASVAQVFLKKEALRTHSSKLKEYMNWRVILGYGMMLISTLFSVYAYRVVPITLGVVLDSTGYLFVTIFGHLFFKERISIQRALALMLILLGIAVYALGG